MKVNSYFFLSVHACIYFSYSVNYGKSWQTFKFHTSPVRVFGILSEPGYHTTVFNIIAEDGANNILIISIDFAPLLGELCVVYLVQTSISFLPFRVAFTAVHAGPGSVLFTCRMYASVTLLCMHACCPVECMCVYV